MMINTLSNVEKLIKLLNRKSRKANIKQRLGKEAKAALTKADRVANKYKITYDYRIRVVIWL